MIALFQLMLSQIGSLRGELRTEVGELRTQMGDLRTGLRVEIGELRTELRGDIARLAEGQERLQQEVSRLSGQMEGVVGHLQHLDRLTEQLVGVRPVTS